MILVTVGTQVHDFKRLFSYLDAVDSSDKIIVQYGHSTYDLEYESFAFDNNLTQYISDASLIVTHGGASTIIEALKLKKKVIVVPRLKQYDEHVDDHQVELSSKLALENYLMVANDEASFVDCFNSIASHTFKEYESNNQQFNLELTSTIKKIIKAD